MTGERVPVRAAVWEGPGEERGHDMSQDMKDIQHQMEKLREGGGQ